MSTAKNGLRRRSLVSLCAMLVFFFCCHITFFLFVFFLQQQNDVNKSNCSVLCCHRPPKQESSYIKWIIDKATSPLKHPKYLSLCSTHISHY